MSVASLKGQVDKAFVGVSDICMDSSSFMTVVVFRQFLHRERKKTITNPGNLFLSLLKQIRERETSENGWVLGYRQTPPLPEQTFLRTNITFLQTLVDQWLCSSLHFTLVREILVKSRVEWVRFNLVLFNLALRKQMTNDYFFFPFPA